MINRASGQRGAALASPRKARAERYAELKALLRLPGGKAVLDYLFMRHTGGLLGTVAPIGASLIKTILDHEYPGG